MSRFLWFSVYNTMLLCQSDKASKL